MNEALTQRLARLARNTRLLGLVDRLLFVRELARHGGANRLFARRHSGFAVPPAALAFDAYGHVSHEAYHSTGVAHARFVAGLVRAHLDRPSPRICEWGCGPARIIRHLAGELADRTPVLFGTDYNPETIAWCRRNIPGVTFEVNGLEPPLPFPAASFDAVYALSVFTHLDARGWESWIDELARVTREGGVVIFTTHGKAYLPKLLPDERRGFLGGAPVFRAKTALGKKCFAAYHPGEFVRAHLSPAFRVIDHNESPGLPALAQDVWVVRRVAG